MIDDTAQAPEVGGDANHPGVEELGGHVLGSAQPRGGTEDVWGGDACFLGTKDGSRTFPPWAVPSGHCPPRHFPLDIIPVCSSLRSR